MMRSGNLPLTVLTCGAAILALLAGAFLVDYRQHADAANMAKVRIQASTPLASLPSGAVGVNTAVWDANLLDPGVPALLRQAGVTTLRFPGGSTADAYHWQTNTVVPSQGGYANPNNTFDAFMGLAAAAGAQPIITVNYGSNATATGGGDPAEAAAWVRYANVIHQYGIRYWEVGNEVYGNGTYDGVSWETDLHARKGPSAYAANYMTYAQAMKAEDPTIKVGAVLAAPGTWPDGKAPDWNGTVLAAACPAIDFVVLHWYPQAPGAESDAGLLAGTSHVSAMMTAARAAINRACGARAGQIEILVTETNSVSSNPGKQTTSLVNVLFLADSLPAWLEQGAANVDWWDLHNSVETANNNAASLYGSYAYGDYGLLSAGIGVNGQQEPAANAPFPAYYGLQMLGYLGKGGDQLVRSSSSVPDLAVHAVRQASGDLAVLLVNKGADTERAVQVTADGYRPSGSATIFRYGQGSTAITAAGRAYGGTFTVQSPAYSLTLVVLHAHAAPAPAFTQVSSAVPAIGQSMRIDTLVRNSGADLRGGIVDIEVYSPSGARLSQQFFSGQSLPRGVSGLYSVTLKGASGPCTVTVGIFGPRWTTRYLWQPHAASLSLP